VAALALTALKTILLHFVLNGSAVRAVYH
jgi:hypothetical protein